jgi:hypothetical protein
MSRFIGRLDITILLRMQRRDNESFVPLVMVAHNWHGIFLLNSRSVYEGHPDVICAPVFTLYQSSRLYVPGTPIHDCRVNA